MTGPVPFPTQFGGGAIMDPGLGATLASSVAQVLSAQQQQRENQFRQQQLAQVAQQQQALQAYYEGQVSIQSREQTAREGELSAKRMAMAQVGSAQARAMGLGGPPVQQTSPGQAPVGNETVNPNAGNMTQGMGGIAGQEPGPFQQVLSGGANALGGAASGEQALSSIFTGVAPENMPDAVAAVQAVQPKPPELPVSAKEFQFMQHLNSLDPAAAQFFYENWVKKQPGVVVNTGDKVETAYGTEMAKSDVQAQAKMVDESKTAAASFPAMAEAYKLVDKSFTGFGANAILGLSRAANATGFKPTGDKVADTQTMVKLLRDGVIAQLQTRALGSGTAVSDADRVFMERQAGADITVDPTTIKRIIRINVGTAIERMVTVKKELEQAKIDHPESARILDGKIKMIESRMKPIWDQYQNMLGDEAKMDATTRMQAGSSGDQLFPARQP